MNWYIFIPLIVGVICAILGYLIGRLTCKKCNENDEIITTNTVEDSNELKSEAVNNFSNIITTPFDADTAKLAMGKKIKNNDLTVVEGIGPKIAELFNNANILTWEELSETSTEKCKDILINGGDRFKLHNPGTWPKQAKLAFEGKWEVLKTLQDELDGGKE